MKYKEDCDYLLFLFSDGSCLEVDLLNDWVVGCVEKALMGVRVVATCRVWLK